MTVSFSEEEVSREKIEIDDFENREIIAKKTTVKVNSEHAVYENGTEMSSTPIKFFTDESLGTIKLFTLPYLYDTLETGGILIINEIVIEKHTMTLHYNNDRENAKNTKYPYRMTIKCVEDLQKVVMYDHVCAEYINSYRKNSNFIQSDCNMFDVDNSDSDNPDEWIKSDDIKKAFSNVPFYISYSRNNMKPKGGKQPRPKFHVYFPDVTIKEASNIKYIKKQFADILHRLTLMPKTLHVSFMEWKILR